MLELKIRTPSKEVCERFSLTYELYGAQMATDFLTRSYKIKRMKIVLDGRKVGKGCVAIYFRNKAYFTKKGLKKRVVLHELYHHIVEAEGLKMPLREEEKKASEFAREVIWKR